MIIMASPSGTPVPAIARLVAVDEDTVRDMLHLINQKGRMRSTLSRQDAVPA